MIAMHIIQENIKDYMKNSTNHSKEEKKVEELKDKNIELHLKK